MDPFKLHAIVIKGDLPSLRAYLSGDPARVEEEINAYDADGYTPLMHAVTSQAADVALLEMLLDHGADIQQQSRSTYGANRTVISLALSAGDTRKVSVLLQRGADIHYRREEGYDALIDAVHGEHVKDDARLLPLLRLLIAQRLDLKGVTRYGESGCRVLSRLGKFAAVQVLLNAGADGEQLQWTPLLRAVALGSLTEVEEQIERGASLEDRDWWERTPLLLAIHAGELDKARLLRERGAKLDACGRCGKSPLFYAIEGHCLPMLRWLLDTGASTATTDEFGDTPLMHAATENNVEAAAALLQAGAQVDTDNDGQTALSNAASAGMAHLLLDAGADPSHLPYEARRALLGLPPAPNQNLLTVSAAEFQEGKHRRFGTANPEKLSVPFWEGMIRAGVTAYQAIQRYEGDEVSYRRPPVWCAQRFGQSITFLPDGRIIQVGGEHEDHYDPDFCIYNDVFVHRPDGRIDFYAYPEAVFPPTDFHTASLVGDFIYLVGSLGYHGQRRCGSTQVYRLDTRTLRLESIPTSGDRPGWISRHRAVLLAANAIRITGGDVVVREGEQETYIKNEQAFVLRTQDGVWLKEPSS